MTDKIFADWQKRRAITLRDLLYSSLIRRFKILAGDEFTFGVLRHSTHLALAEFLKGQGADAAQLSQFLKKVIADATGGKVVSCEIAKNGGVVRVKNSAEALSHGPSEGGVCYLTAGMVEAVAEKIIGHGVKVRERKCMAKGNDFCEFAVIA